MPTLLMSGGTEEAPGSECAAQLVCSKHDVQGWLLSTCTALTQLQSSRATPTLALSLAFHTQSKDTWKVPTKARDRVVASPGVCERPWAFAYTYKTNLAIYPLTLSFNKSGLLCPLKRTLIS